MRTDWYTLKNCLNRSIALLKSRVDTYIILTSRLKSIKYLRYFQCIFLSIFHIHRFLFLVKAENIAETIQRENQKVWIKKGKMTNTDTVEQRWRQQLTVAKKQTNIKVINRKLKWIQKNKHFNRNWKEYRTWNKKAKPSIMNIYKQIYIGVYVIICMYG